MATSQDEEYAIASCNALLRIATALERIARCVEPDYFNPNKDWFKVHND